MSLNNASIVTAPSSIAATGGTTLSFELFQSPRPGTSVLYVPADSDFRLRRTLTARIGQPTASKASPDGYTQAWADMRYFRPRLLANGLYTIDSVYVKVSRSVEAPAADVQHLLDVGAQMLFDSDFTPTFKDLKLS